MTEKVKGEKNPVIAWSSYQQVDSLRKQIRRLTSKLSEAKRQQDLVIETVWVQLLETYSAKFQGKNFRKFMNNLPFEEGRAVNYILKSRFERALIESIEAIEDGDEIKSHRTDQPHTNPLEDFVLNAFNERLLEIPTALRFITNRPDRVYSLLDIGAALNYQPVIDQLQKNQTKVCFFTQSSEKEPINMSGETSSYFFGDAESLPFKDKHFEFVSCVSTFEHFGYSNKNFGVTDATDLSPAKKSQKVRNSVTEIKRCLNDGGGFFFTVPVHAGEKDIISKKQHSIFSLPTAYSFSEPFKSKSEFYFNRTPKGWRKSPELSLSGTEFSIYCCLCQV